MKYIIILLLFTACDSETGFYYEEPPPPKIDNLTHDSIVLSSEDIALGWTTNTDSISIVEDNPLGYFQSRLDMECLDKEKPANILLHKWDYCHKWNDIVLEKYYSLENPLKLECNKMNIHVVRKENKLEVWCSP